MAKSIDLFIILLGGVLCFYPSNDGFHVDDGSIRDRLQEVYSSEIGVREKTNRNDGERVAEYLRYSGLSEGYAWCAAFVSWAYGEVGLKQPKTAWSPSLFPSKRLVWNRGPIKGKLIEGLSKKDNHLPQKGDVFGIYFTNLKRIAHAGFVDEWGDKYVITTEGNTNEGGSREGDGVYRKRRLISSIYQVADWVNSN